MKTEQLKKTVFIILKIYALSLSIFFIFRLILFFTEIHRLNLTLETNEDILYAFLTGLRFDIVITGYIMFFPTLILLISAIINVRNKIITKFIFFFLLFLFFLSFLISTADIPYFNQFFKRFEIGAFEWMDSPVFVFKMILEEPRYILISIPFLLIIYLFYKILKKIFKEYENTPFSENNKRLFLKIFISLFFLSLIFLGIRGRIQKKSPIRTGTAYFCQNPFLNQLGLNPVFTLIRSYLDSVDKRNEYINLTDNQTAIKNIQKYLNINKNNRYEYSPVARKIIYDSVVSTKPNIVIIIMESMSAVKMDRFGNNKNLTPFLDSLSYQSYFFNNIYTAGEHTYNGIFSTLFSFPALYRQHTMKKIRKYEGISHTLKKIGYTTTHFITHDGQFDNVEGFLRANDFDNIISQSDYPGKEVKTTLGVPDDYMFRFSIPIINKLHKKEKPFFVSFMTVSDHGPYYVPKYFKPHSDNIKNRVIEYADWSLRRFISLAKETDWFENTIFVFVADHGAAINVKYSIPLNYHHSPLIIYAPKMLSPKLFNCIGGQIDIYPTLMGILKQSYINNTLGIDLINEKRPYIIINGDDKVAALDSEFLFILKNNEKMLYKYKVNDKTNYIDKYTDKAIDMEVYLKSNLQTYQYMLINEKSLFNDISGK